MVVNVHHRYARLEQQPIRGRMGPRRLRQVDGGLVADGVLGRLCWAADERTQTFFLKVIADRDLVLLRYLPRDTARIVLIPEALDRRVVLIGRVEQRVLRRVVEGARQLRVLAPYVGRDEEPQLVLFHGAAERHAVVPERNDPARIRQTASLE